MLEPADGGGGVVGGGGGTGDSGGGGDDGSCGGIGGCGGGFLYLQMIQRILNELSGLVQS